MRVYVATVDLDVVYAPVGKRLGVSFEVAKNSWIASAGVVAVVLVDAELQPEVVNLESTFIVL